MDSQEQMQETEQPISEDFLMVTSVGDYTAHTKSTQTEEKVKEIRKDLLITTHEVIASKQLIKGLTVVLDKVWTTFLAFNIVVLPCIVGMSVHHLNTWMGNILGNVPVIVTFVLTGCLFTGLPLYIFFLADMDRMIADMIEGKISLAGDQSDQSSQTTTLANSQEETPNENTAIDTSNEKDN